MEDGKKIFIRGSKEHGDKVIRYLEEHGGINSSMYGDSIGSIYFINHDDFINCISDECEMSKIVMDNYREVTIDDLIVYFVGKVNKWEYDGKHIVNGYHIASDSHIDCKALSANDWNKNIFATEKQAKSSLAMAQISQYMLNDPRYGGVVTDEEWKRPDIFTYVIVRQNNLLGYAVRSSEYEFLAFHTWEQRELFLTEHEDLVREYLMID